MARPFEIISVRGIYEDATFPCLVLGVGRRVLAVVNINMCWSLLVSEWAPLLDNDRIRMHFLVDYGKGNVAEKV